MGKPLAWAVSAVSSVALLAGCFGRTPPPPGPGYERGGLPDLRGSRVMVLPLQIRTGAHPDVGREIEFALGRPGGSVEWVGPEALQETIARSPGLEVQIDELPVGVFLTGAVERIGDPLFGALYRLGALTDTPVALLPVEARALARDGEESVQISAALVDTRTGVVVWFGIVEGQRGPPGELSLAATAADALARRVMVP